MGYVQYKAFKKLLTSKLELKEFNEYLLFFLKLYLDSVKKIPGIYFLWPLFGPRAVSPLLFSKKKIKRYFNDFYNHSLKLDYFYFLKYICIFKAKMSRSNSSLQHNKLNYFNVKDDRVFANSPTKKGFFICHFCQKKHIF